MDVRVREGCTAHMLEAARLKCRVAVGLVRRALARVQIVRGDLSREPHTHISELGRPKTQFTPLWARREAKHA